MSTRKTILQYPTVDHTFPEHAGQEGERAAEGVLIGEIISSGARALSHSTCAGGWTRGQATP